MMKKNAGMRVDFEKFWAYYNEHARKQYSSACKTDFHRTFTQAMLEDGYMNGGYINCVNLVSENMDKLCRKSAQEMRKRGVPEEGIRSFTSHFKKWFESYYGK